MVRAYQTLANVKIEHIGSAATQISPLVRNQIVHDLFKVSKNPKPLKWSQLRKRLGLADTDTFAGIRQSDEAKDICVKVPAWNALCSTLHDLNPGPAQSPARRYRPRRRGMRRGDVCILIRVVRHPNCRSGLTGLRKRTWRRSSSCLWLEAVHGLRLDEPEGAADAARCI